MIFYAPASNPSSLFQLYFTPIKTRTWFSDGIGKNPIFIPSEFFRIWHNYNFGESAIGGLPDDGSERGGS